MADIPTGTDSAEVQDVVVGLFDILGFAQRIRGASDLRRLVSAYQSFLELKLNAGAIPILSLDGRQNARSPSAVFSDTILFWARAEPVEVEAFLHTCSVLIADALNQQWPIRGGIAAGECYLNRAERVFVGLPIVEAYELEQSQDWIGASFHSSALTHPSVGATIKAHESVVTYDVPVKSDCAFKPRHALAWHHFGYDSLADLAAFGIQPSHRAFRYYRNAEVFLEAHPLK